MSNTEECCGYTNWDTYAVSLHLMNDYATYTYLIEPSTDSINKRLTDILSIMALDPQFSEIDFNNSVNFEELYELVKETIRDIKQGDL